jgi:hypothetical protein
VRRRAGDPLEDAVAGALESLGFDVGVGLGVQGRDGEAEVGVWGEKLVEGARFAVYASCKNWDGPVDVGTVREELGRVPRMAVIPHVRILVAPSFTERARREALAGGFIVVEVGEKAREDNVDKIYSRVYHGLDRVFAGVAPRRLRELAGRAWELAGRARELAGRARRVAEEVERVGAELERVAAAAGPPPAPSAPQPGPPGGALDEVFDGLGVPGDLRARAKRLLLHVYTTCYVLYFDRGGGVAGDEAAYRVLSRLGLVGLYRCSRRRWYEVILYRESAGVAAGLAREHVESVRGALGRLVEEHGWDAALTACAKGAVDLEREGFEPEFLKPEGVPLPARVAAAVGAVKPLLKERYLGLWGGLGGLDLAFRCGERLRMLPEARDAIMEIVRGRVEEFGGREALVRRLAALNLLYHYRRLPAGAEGGRHFMRLLGELGLGPEDLAEAAEGLRGRGLVLRSATTPPYVVAHDAGAFEKAVVEEIKRLYGQAVRP